MPAFRLALRILGLPRLRAWMARSARTDGAWTPTLAEVIELARLVNGAANHAIVPATCLTRSCCLVWLLGRHGVAAELRIGVSRAGGAFAAHAWVEYQGVPVNDTADVADRFAPFDTLPPPGAFNRS